MTFLRLYKATKVRFFTFSS